MKFNVEIIADAEDDLFEIYRHVALTDSREKAEKLLDNLEKTCRKLETLPGRGHIPPELERIGVFEYLEIHYKPYRIIYQVIRSNVFIHYVLDGRRDLQELLQQRLLR